MRARLRSAPIFVQVLALVLVSLVAAQAINLAVVLNLPDPPPPGFSVAEAAQALKGETVRTHDGKQLRAKLQPGPPEFPSPQGDDPLSGVIRLVLARQLDVPAEQVKVALRAPEMKVRREVRSLAFHRRHVAEHERMFVTVRPEDGPDHLKVFNKRLSAAPERMQIFSDNLVFPPFAAALQRRDGQWLVVEPLRPLLSPWQVRTLIWFALSALLLAPVAWWVARRLARPIHAFAEAAERLGRDPAAPPLAYEGPEEVRTAVAAFNDMQQKLHQYVESRTAMVAAIAHDLRTPLTRLRFRVEGAPEEVRNRAAGDIEQMDAMISAALAFVRGESGGAERSPLDLGALAGSVVDDMADTGADVGFEGAPGVVIEGDGLALKRLVANLVDNAVKFGGRARVRLAREGSDAVLTVDDDGPGVPPAEMAKVFDPFYRADAARTAGGGFGLGLSTARSIAQAHGGEVALENRAGGGLRATVRLPIA
jgi:signal transduction histidine kinase